MPTLDPLAADAAAYLQAFYKGPLPSRPKQLVTFLKAKAWTPVSDAQKVELIALVTALVVTFSGNPKVNTALAASREKGGTSVELARLFLEAVHADTSDPARKLRRLSTWTAAVRYLVSAKVAPSAIEDLASTTGNGIDAWSRKAAQKRSQRPKVKQPSVAKLQVGTVTISYGSLSETYEVNDYRVLRKMVGDARKLQAAYPVPQKARKSG